MRRLALVSFAVMSVALLGGLAASEAIAAPPAYSGADAAYIDWAWKTCELKSTKKEHELSDQARAKNGDVFLKAYEAEYKKILEKGSDPVAVRHLCQSIKDWYGEAGTKIDSLVEAKSARRR